MNLASKLKRLERKYQNHIENAYSFKYEDPSLSDYFQFKAQKALAKIQFLSRISA